MMNVQLVVQCIPVRPFVANNELPDVDDAVLSQLLHFVAFRRFDVAVGYIFVLIKHLFYIN
jgi:hypothetical protein